MYDTAADASEATQSGPSSTSLKWTEVYDNEGESLKIEVGGDTEGSKRMMMRLTEEVSMKKWESAIPALFWDDLFIPHSLAVKKRVKKLSGMMKRGTVTVSEDSEGDRQVKLSYSDPDWDSPLRTTLLLSLVPLTKDDVIRNLRGKLGGFLDLKEQNEILIEEQKEREEELAQLAAEKDRLKKELDELKEEKKDDSDEKMAEIIGDVTLEDIIEKDEHSGLMDALAKHFGWDKEAEADADGNPLFMVLMWEPESEIQIVHSKYSFVHCRKSVKKSARYKCYSATEICAMNTKLTGLLRWIIRDGKVSSNAGYSGALTCAARWGVISAAQVLMDDHKLEKNKIDPFGRTALMMAAKHGHSEMVSFLLGKGCDSKMKCMKEKTALDYAVQSGHPECAALLR